MPAGLLRALRHWWRSVRMPGPAAPAALPPAPAGASPDPPLAVQDANTASAGRHRVQQAVSHRDWDTVRQSALASLTGVPPPDYDLLALACFSLQQAGQWPAVLETAIPAALRLPGYWLFPFLAGTAHTVLGDAAAAVPLLQEAASLRPDHRDTRRALLQAIAESSSLDAAALWHATHPMPGPATPWQQAPVRGFAELGRLGLGLLTHPHDMPTEPIPFRAPRVWGEPDNPRVTLVAGNPPCVVELHDARIFSHSSLVLTADGSVLHDAAGHPAFGRHVRFAYEPVVLAWRDGAVLLDWPHLVTREIAAGMHLGGLASDAFGHWLPEFLPRLQWLQAHPDYATLPLIVDADMPASHFEHLQRLCDRPLLRLAAGETLLCRRLLVASSPAFSPVELAPHALPVDALPGLSPRALRFLRTGVPPATGVPFRRLLLTRRHSNWRRLLNEEEIVAALQARGFEDVCPETLPAAAQIRLFQQAACIVAPHGSALLNLVFAAGHTPVLVLLPPNAHNWGTFQGPMEALGYPSLCVRGDHAIDDGEKQADYHVPLDHILAALATLGIADLAGQAGPPPGVT